MTILPISWPLLTIKLLIARYAHKASWNALTCMLFFEEPVPFNENCIIVRLFHYSSSQEKTGMKFLYQRAFRTYHLNVLLASLVFLSLQARISHSEGESSFSVVVSFEYVNQFQLCGN